jgi:hypothetical protein
MLDLGYSYWCRKCGHALNWQGKYTDMPPCPKCGDRPDASTLEQLQRMHEQIAAAALREEHFKPVDEPAPRSDSLVCSLCGRPKVEGETWLPDQGIHLRCLAQDRDG